MSLLQLGSDERTDRIIRLKNGHWKHGAHLRESSLSAKRMDHIRFWQNMESHSDSSGDLNDATVYNGVGGFQVIDKRY